MARSWSWRGSGIDLKLDGIEHSQLVRNTVWDTDGTYDNDGADAHDPSVQFVPFEGPVAAKGGNGGGGNGGGGGGGGGGSGTAPTDITLTNDLVDENSAGGTVIGTFGAVDADKKERFTFTLTDDANGLSDGILDGFGA